MQRVPTDGVHKRSFASRTLLSQSSGRSTTACAEHASETSASDADAPATAPAVQLRTPERPSSRPTSKQCAPSQKHSTLQQHHHTTPTPLPGSHAARHSLMSCSFGTPAVTCPSRQAASSSSRQAPSVVQNTASTQSPVLHPVTSTRPSRKRTRSPPPALPPSALADATALPPASLRPTACAHLDGSGSLAAVAL